MSAFECDSCSRVFNTWHACKQHMNATDHWALEEHECETCTACFRTSGAANQHMEMYDHWAYDNECETCTACFKTPGAANQHMDMKDHWAYDYECDTCTTVFRTEYARNQHQRDKGHYKHLHCSHCERYFDNENNLRQHLKSRIHQGANVECPFCETGFTTASGVTHHLESASCPKARNLNRDVIHRVLRQRDTRGVFTEERLLEWHGSNDGQVQWDPVSAWNGSEYECYICHRGFGTSRALSQHVASPAHQAPLYHCPNETCGGKRFPSLAALFNHLESESCGYAKFSTVQKNVNGFLTGRGQMLIRY